MLLKITKKDKRTKLEMEIDNVLERMGSLDPSSEEYTSITNNLERLYKAKGCEVNRFITPDTLALIAGNLLGLLIIMNYEKTNVISTKALGFIMRGRV
jgi:hypothetical protein